MRDKSRERPGPSENQATNESVRQRPVRQRMNDAHIMNVNHVKFQKEFDSRTISKEFNTLNCDRYTPLISSLPVDST